MTREAWKRPETLIKIGYIALIPALLSRWVQPGQHLSETWVDGGRGFLFGIAIGAMLLGVWRRGRQHSAGPGDCVD